MAHILRHKCTYCLVIGAALTVGCGDERGPTAQGSAAATSEGLSLVNPLVPSLDVNLGRHVVGVTSQIALTLTNIHSKAITLGPIVFDGTAPVFAVSGGTCRDKLRLVRGASCILNVAFTPTALGEVSMGLRVDYRTGSTRLTAGWFWVTGAGDPPVVLSDPQAVAFGRPLVGTTATKTVTVTNLGATATLGTISDAALGVSPPYALSGGSCATGTQLQRGESCTLDITFTPTVAGAAPQPMTLSYTLAALGTWSLKSTLYGTAITDPTNCFQASCPAQHVCEQTSAAPMTGTCVYVPPPPPGCMAPCEWEAQSNCLPAMGDCTQEYHQDEQYRPHTWYCDKSSGWLTYTHNGTIAQYPNPRDPSAVYDWVYVTDNRSNGQTCLKRVTYGNYDFPRRYETYIYSAAGQFVGLQEGAGDTTIQTVTCADGSTYSEIEPKTAECQQWYDTHINKTFCRTFTSGSCAAH